jgi:hypothetical protein
MAKRKGRRLPAPAKGTIHIHVNRGNFTYIPSHYRAERGEQITFKCDQGPFEIMFQSRTPGDRLYICDESPTITITGSQEGAAANEYASYGLYHYSAAVAVLPRDRRHGKVRVYLDSGCGDIGVGK